jgi:protein tyrosine phosphatase (PTP) superfamily phosphohydrolase (DUF442 family)
VLNVSPDVAGILNFRATPEGWLTAGQPTAEQLVAIAASGVRTVINLALPTSPGALPDERAAVERLGMEYRHLPVNFEEPTVADYLAFESELDRCAGRGLLVHCAMNYRVSAFVAAYRVRRLGWQPTQALDELASFWQPEPQWQRLLSELISEQR